MLPAAPATARRSSRSERRRAATRRRLLDATRQSIAANGLDATTIAGIAEAADLGFGTFYLHFASKEEAIEAVVAETAEELGAALDRLTQPLDDMAEVLAVCIRHVVARADVDAPWARFVVQVSAADRTVVGALAGRLRRDLEGGVRAGRFDADPRGLVTIAIGAIVHAAMLARLEGAVGTEAPSAAAESSLRLLGVDASEARAIVNRPLPALEEVRKS